MSLFYMCSKVASSSKENVTESENPNVTKLKILQYCYSLVVSQSVKTKKSKHFVCWETLCKL